MHSIGNSQKNAIKWGNALIMLNIEEMTIFDGLDSAHIAIFQQPYLHYILDHKKTIESRFSINRVNPLFNVRRGDMLLLKESGKEITGQCEVERVLYTPLNHSIVSKVKEAYSQQLCADEMFWEQRRMKNYACFFWLTNVNKIEPLAYKKRNQMAWVSQKKLAHYDEENIYIAFAGKIGAGKTFYSNKLRDEFRTKYCSFGSMVKQICNDFGFPMDRVSLQRVGGFIADKYPEFLLKNTLCNATPSNESVCVIDGIRHSSIIHLLRQYSKTCLLVYVDTDENARKENIEFRDGMYTNNDSGKTEEEHEMLLMQADYIIKTHDDYIKLALDVKKMAENR